SVENLVLVVSLGLLMTLLPFTLFNYALDRIEAGKASIITFAEPLTATAIGFLLYGEVLTIEAAIGMAMIMAALVAINRKTEKEIARLR
ncbi:MAG: EamA family transporter, partial [Candidatus Methanomethylophilaceae archaeon]|nr:EamA family transporter [Candidatus Methanomethylophilaceae archaeon]